MSATPAGAASAAISCTGRSRARSRRATPATAPPCASCPWRWRPSASPARPRRGRSRRRAPPIIIRCRTTHASRSFAWRMASCAGRENNMCARWPRTSRANTGLSASSPIRANARPSLSTPCRPCCTTRFGADSFADCVIRTVNQGGDADTAGALAGMLAGAAYGLDAIPPRWLAKLDRDIAFAIRAQAPLLLAISRGAGGEGF